MDVLDGNPTTGFLVGACRTSVLIYEPGGGTPPPATEQCQDSIGNNGDGLIDFPANPGCTDANDNDETDVAPPPPPPVYQCSDGVDNDLDGWTDKADPGCTSITDNHEMASTSIKKAS